MKEKKIKLTPSQTRVMAQILDFIDGKDRVFILKGYAGTGKTTLLRFLLTELRKRNHNYRLLAPTGRAAKVMANLSSTEQQAAPAQTIHSMLYTFHGLNEEVDITRDYTHNDGSELYLNFEPARIKFDDIYAPPETIYIIDEASMVADMPPHVIVQAKFGSGKLLTELLNFDTRERSKFIFIGDPCQLPPIEQYFSPALMPAYFEQHFSLHAQEAMLTEIMRQNDDSTLITASKQIRALHDAAPAPSHYGPHDKMWSKLPLRGNRDIVFLDSLNELINLYVNQVKSNGVDSALFISRENKRCLSISNQIRTLLGHGHRLQKGDLLMVNQNCAVVPLVNGDMVTVEQVSDTVEICAGFTFRMVTVRERFSKKIYETWLLEDILYQAAPNLDKEQNKLLLIDYAKRMAKIGLRQSMHAFYEQMRSDPFLNALRCSFGYCVTCHKAQGGEWDKVFVDMPRNITLNPTPEKYQWVYTAMTRATQTLYLVNDFFYR